MIPCKNTMLYQVDYQHWANEALFASLDKLSDEARKRDEGLPQKSIHETLRTLLWLNLQWTARFQEAAQPRPMDKSDFEDWRELKQGLRLSTRQLQHELKAKPEDFFETELSYESTSGKQRSNWVHDLLSHLSFSQSHQRGMVLAVALRLGAPLPELDYLQYRREMQESLNHARSVAAMAAAGH